MSKKYFVLFFFWIGIQTSVWGAPPVHNPNVGRKVVVISVDGLRPDFYLNNEFSAPVLKGLVQKGAVAQGMLPVFPSLTYPVHATLMTGVTSAKHGILSNMIFSPETGPSYNWYREAASIKAPTLWDRAKAAGLKTAIIHWPGTIGASVDWFVPEIFNSPGFNFETDWKLIEEHTQSDLMKEIFAGSKPKGYRSLQELDDFTARAAIHVLGKYHPALTLIHLVNLDFVEHMTGRFSEETKSALKESDALLGKILGAIGGDSTVLILGDHGFEDYSKTIHINTLFKERGWIHLEGKKLIDWKVIAQAEGGQAAIYLKDKSLEKDVLRELTRVAPGKFQILSNKVLKKLGAYPDALCALDAVDGYSLGTAMEGPLEVSLPKVKGMHGQLPSSHPHLQAGFVAVGPGIAQHKKLGIIRAIDVAPTIADLLGFAFPSAEGKSIRLKMQD
jgi:predicted AlkP superfamily pyrophosphatase or phosphodiesterase